MLGVLLMLVGIGSLICWVIVLTKLFPAEGVGMGILGIICGLYTFIWGWQHADEHNIRQIMIAWTACFILSLILRFAVPTGGAPLVPTPVP